MQVELKVNDKSVQAEIPEEQLKETVLFEQLKKLGLIEDKPRTGYERVKKDEMYYVINTKDDSMINVKEFKDETDEQYYNIGNYYNDKVIAENNARADKLLRCLRRWQAAKDKAITKKDWENEDIKKYCISYDYSAKELIIEECWEVRQTNVIYFSTQEKAQEAIKQFREDLLWYYTKYQQRLDEE